MITFEELKEKCTCWTGYKRKPGTKPCAPGSCIKEGTDDVTEKHHVLAFGRMNPITHGHEAVVNKVHEVAKEHGATHNVVVSHSQDAKKNPLTGEQKVKHAKHAFPDTNVSAASKDKPTILHHAAEAHKAGATHLHVVAGSDRKEEMHNLLHKYNDKESAHGHYNFKKITVHSSGERDPDSEGTSGISASKMREHAASGNKEAFHAGAPSKMKPEHKDAMYHDVRKGMNIKEETTPYWKKPSFNKRMSKMAKQERLEREKKEAEKKPVKEETLDQQADREKQLKRFKDQMAKLTVPTKDIELGLDKKETEALQQVQEVLHPNMGAGAYIHDFIKSTNPRFNNKSKEERRKMAIGAYMAAKASMKEETEQIDELSKETLTRYKDKAGKALDWAKGKLRRAIDNNEYKDSMDASRVVDNRKQGLKKADKRLGEETEQIDELSTDLLARYKTASAASAKAADASGNYAKGDKRFKGINKATNKQFDNDLKKHGQMKEGTIQTNGTDQIDTATSAPSASTAKDTTMGKKIKGFKFFNGENDKQMNMAQPVKEETVEEGYRSYSGRSHGHAYGGGGFGKREREDDEYHVPDPTPVAPTLHKKYIKGTPENKAAKAASKPINGHPTNEEVLDEKSIQARRNKTYKNLMAASKGARVNQDLGMTPADTGHKNKQQMNKAIGRAVSRGEVHEASTGNPGSGYHGSVPSADDKYEEMHKHVKNLTDGDDKTVKHYLDSGHGKKLAGREDDHEHIKSDFKKFMKYYRPEMHDPKSVNVDKVNAAGDKPHDEKFESAKKASKLKKEETMKSYKEFLQSLDEASKKKPSWLLAAELKAEKKEGKLKEEAEDLDEVKMADLPSRSIKGKSYGANYEDPAGAFETKDDMKKADKKPAGRKIGQSVGSYKRRQPKAAC